MILSAIRNLLTWPCPWCRRYVVSSTLFQSPATVRIRTNCAYSRRKGRPHGAARGPATHGALVPDGRTWLHARAHHGTPALHLGASGRTASIAAGGRPGELDPRAAR